MELSLYRMTVVAVAAGLVAASLGGGVASSAGLSDKKPHSGVAAAREMPIQGIDVSYWQGDVDWQEVDDAGVRFAYIKATEGGDRLDPKIPGELAWRKEGRRCPRRLSCHVLVRARA